jgi:hypothetical protein
VTIIFERVLYYEPVTGLFFLMPKDWGILSLLRNLHSQKWNFFLQILAPSSYPSAILEIKFSDATSSLFYYSGIVVGQDGVPGYS